MSFKNILALARAGATSRAWEVFQTLENVGTASLTLKGRLLKDRARKASGAERIALFADAQRAYEAAAGEQADSYPLINAAAMALFAGDLVRSELLANKVLHLIDSGSDKGETPYWCEATRAEALLLLGRETAAQASLEKAIGLAPEAWEDRASTLRQFAMIAEESGGNSGWLDPFRAPPVLHFSGILGIAADDADAVSRVRAAVLGIAPGFAVGALAAGADIIAAEILVERGSELHVVLPSEPDEFRRSSVETCGVAWVPRFEHMLAEAQSLTVCSNGALTSAAGVALAEFHAMGLAAELAGQLETRAVALRIEPAQRYRYSDPWIQSGRELHRLDIIPVTQDSPAPLPDGELIFEIAINGDAASTCYDLGEAVKLLSTAKDQIAAFDCRIDGQQRVQALLARSEPGLLVASRDAGLALLACGAVQSLEPIGEMATPFGPVELCLTQIAAVGG